MLPLSMHWHRSIQEISQEHWDRLLGKQATPFYRWRWLMDLETSGSIVPGKGWQALHLSLWRGENLVAFAPLYLKGHSYGEFVFDQSFARLAADLGLRYYPKLIGMSPVSPIQGYRFHVAPEENVAELTALMLNLIDEFAKRNGILSCNFLYVDPEWQQFAQASGCAMWLNQHSCWNAKNQKNFSDYLAGFNANQRRNIRRERQAVKAAGIQVTPVTGTSLDSSLLNKMYDFYEQHCGRWGPWGSKYLHDEFFARLSDKYYQDQVVLFSAHRGNPYNPIAMSLCIQDTNSLWGRYWGSYEEISCLHFEVCYYAPIAWALKCGISCFDPGAGGTHKRRRGFTVYANASLHRWYDSRMDSLIRAWLEKVNPLMLEEIEAINAELPFRQETPSLTL